MLIRLLVILYVFIGIGCQEPQSSPPNIVIIFADDLGYGDLGCYGAIDYQTPHLDKMARDGMRFTQFYSVQAVCSASRAALLTGCYPNRIGVSGAYFPKDSVGLHPDEQTIAELLKDIGYATGIFGKWHLGHLEDFMPLQHGFDSYVGVPYSNDMWPVDYDGVQVDSSHRKIRFPQLPLIQGNEMISELRTLEDQAELTTIYTEKAVEFIDAHANQPFFLYVPHTMPHVPLAVSSKFAGKSKQGLYGDVIMEIDWSVGQILDALENNNLSDNTLVIFTSDNGPWLNYGNHAGNTGGLREGKGTSFEGGQREPMIAKWPGHIPEGAICQNLAATIDILPTVAKITGASLPTAEIDGVDISSLLTGDVGAEPRNSLLYYYGRNQLEAVRLREWKLVLPHPHRSYEEVVPGNDGYPGPLRRVQFEKKALYNLRRDPGERYDVKELYPDVVQELEELVLQARKELGDDLTGVVGEENRPLGRLSGE